MIQEVVDWLEYAGRKAEVKDFLVGVNSYLSLDKSTTSWRDMLSALEYMEGSDVDYVDALTLQMMRRRGLKEIYSNDKDFDRVDWVKRVWK